MKTISVAAAVAATILAWGAAASAATIKTVELSPGANDTMSGSFNDNAIKADDLTKGAAGLFVHEFDFVLPTSGLLSASLTTIFTPDPKHKKDFTSNVDFIEILLNGEKFTLSPTGNVEFASLTGFHVNAGLNRIVVRGLTGGNGALGGSLDFVADSLGVPEPASWALMILGFAGSGLALRRRQRIVAVR